ncbi:hypothetical protein KG089_01525 [Carnobacteriaceae bacterium zg-ZUI252]|nr:hypothetical protein [Carnobacteriaceae bacterium zg-ZUI252]
MSENKRKKVIIGVMITTVLACGATLALLNQPNNTIAKNEAVVTNKVENKSESAIKAIESQLLIEPTAETNVQELEKKLAEITDESVKEKLTEKVNAYKEKVVAKVDEKKKAEAANTPVATPQVNEASATTQNVNESNGSTPQVNTPKESDSTPQPRVEKPAVVKDEQPAPKVSTPKPQPAQTTQATTQAPVTTTQKPAPKPVPKKEKKLIMGSQIGNSGRVFDTYEEAFEWGWQEGLKKGSGRYVVGPVIYEGDEVKYTVDWI